MKHNLINFILKFYCETGVDVDADFSSDISIILWLDRKTTLRVLILVGTYFGCWPKSEILLNLAGI